MIAHCSFLDFHNQALWRWFWKQISNQYHKLLDLKIQINYTHFPSIFCRSCQIHCFLHIVAAIPMTWHIQVVIWCKNVIQTFQPFWNSSNCVQKAVDLITPAKNRKKMSLADWIFRSKKSWYWLYTGLKFTFKITFT